MKCSMLLRRMPLLLTTALSTAATSATAPSRNVSTRTLSYPSARFTHSCSHHCNIAAVSTTRRHVSSNSSNSNVEAKPHVVHYSKLGMDGFTDVKYNTAADELLESIESRLETLDSPLLEDVSGSGGVLTIETTSKGTFILNKQAPNVQLWLSSPISGPHHYNMMTSTANGVETVMWKSDHDEHDLVERLEQELSEVLDQPFQVQRTAEES